MFETLTPYIKISILPEPIGQTCLQDKKLNWPHLWE